MPAKSSSPLEQLLWFAWSLVAVYCATITSLAIFNTLLSALLTVESFILRVLLFITIQRRGRTRNQR